MANGESNAMPCELGQLRERKGTSIKVVNKIPTRSPPRRRLTGLWPNNTPTHAGQQPLGIGCNSQSFGFYCKVFLAILVWFIPFFCFLGFGVGCWQLYVASEEEEQVQIINLFPLSLSPSVHAYIGGFRRKQRQ